MNKCTQFNRSPLDIRWNMWYIQMRKWEFSCRIFQTMHVHAIGTNCNCCFWMVFHITLEKWNWTEFKFTGETEYSNCWQLNEMDENLCFYYLTLFWGFKKIRWNKQTNKFMSKKRINRIGITVFESAKNG